jgi:hypothetical protein
MITLFVLSAVLILCGLCIGFIATSNAPLGFENETGFHYGQPPGTPALEEPDLAIPQARNA